LIVIAITLESLVSDELEDLLLGRRHELVLEGQAHSMADTLAIVLAAVILNVAI
jgi:hypothetical protein